MNTDKAAYGGRVPGGHSASGGMVLTMVHPDGNGAPRQLVEEALLDAIGAMTPWERIRHNDRMLRTLRLLRGPPKDEEETVEVG